MVGPGLIVFSFSFFLSLFFPFFCSLFFVLLFPLLLSFDIYFNLLNWIFFKNEKNKIKADLGLFVGWEKSKRILKSLRRSLIVGKKGS